MQKKRQQIIFFTVFVIACGTALWTFRGYLHTAVSDMKLTFSAPASPAEKTENPRIAAAEKRFNEAQRQIIDANKKIADLVEQGKITAGGNDELRQQVADLKNNVSALTNTLQTHETEILALNDLEEYQRKYQTTKPALPEIPPVLGRVSSLHPNAESNSRPSTASGALDHPELAPVFIDEDGARTTTEQERSPLFPERQTHSSALRIPSVEEGSDPEFMIVACRHEGGRIKVRGVARHLGPDRYFVQLKSASALDDQGNLIDVWPAWLRNNDLNFGGFGPGTTMDGAPLNGPVPESRFSVSLKDDDPNVRHLQSLELTLASNDWGTFVRTFQNIPVQ